MPHIYFFFLYFFLLYDIFVSTMCIFHDYCVNYYKSTELVSLYTLNIQSLTIMRYEIEDAVMSWIKANILFLTTFHQNSNKQAMTNE